MPEYREVKVTRREPAAPASGESAEQEGSARDLNPEELTAQEGFVVPEGGTASPGTAGATVVEVSPDMSPDEAAAIQNTPSAKPS